MFELIKQIQGLPLGSILFRASLVLLIALPFFVALSRVTDSVPPPNLPLRTLGGKQLWSDIFVHAGWRIQEHVYTGHARLLDSNNVRRAWGSYEDCRAHFEGERERLNLKWSGSNLVILVHGLGGARHTVSDLERALSQAGLMTISIAYPSSRQSFADHADDLEHVLLRLKGIETVSFVTYSLGGPVVGELLSRPSVRDLDLKFDRMVMIAPPNGGARAAELLRDVPLYDFLLTDTGEDVLPNRARRIPLADLEIGIIAGGRGDKGGYNPLLEGDDDGLIRVSETLLPGTDDFLLIDDIHWTINNHPQTILATYSFLQHGKFQPNQ